MAAGPGAGYAGELPALTLAAQGKGDAIPVIAVSAAVGERLLRAGGLDPKALAAGLETGAEAGAATALEGVEIGAQVALDLEKRIGRNVIGRLRMGGDPEAPPVVIGAHVDHLGRGGNYASLARPGRGRPGALRRG